MLVDNLKIGESIMQEKKIGNRISSIPLDKLIAHPDNPNRMSKTNFKKLIRNIERTGRYEPLIVRPSPQQPGFYQIINGHHRKRALQKLGYKKADTLIWNINDEDADIMLTTLNRLGGSDVLEKKLVLLKRLNKRMQTNSLAKLLPQTAKQIERLANLKRPTAPPLPAKNSFLNTMVFFLNDKQHKIVAEALSLAGKDCPLPASTKAANNAEAVTCIARQFLNKTKTD
jgi:ParB/RepB/Spo0J family partition protein